MRRFGVSRSLAVAALLVWGLVGGCFAPGGADDPSNDGGFTFEAGGDVADGGACKDGERRQTGCNTCVCRNGRWACTGRACVDSTDIQPIPDDGANNCGNTGHGTPAQIDSTPRAEPDLEQLALTLTDQVVAPQKIYDRVTRDVAKIRSDYSEVADITYRPHQDGKSIVVSVEDGETRRAIENDEYQAWRCLNEHYVLEEVKHLVEKSFILELKGIYDMAVVAGDYAALPGIEAAEPNYTIGDGPTICAERGSGGLYRYVFDDASGDCPSGCIDHVYHYFEVGQGGSVTKKGRWEGDGAEPGWVSICQNRR